MRKLIFTLVLSFVFHCHFATAAFATNTQTDWPMAGADPQRTSHNNVDVRGPYKPVWYRPIDPYIDNKVQAIAAENKIFVASSKGLYAFDANNGNQLWVFGTEMPLGNSPTYYNGVLYVGGMDHHVYAINAVDGSLKWVSAEAGAGFDTNPLVINDSYTGNATVIFLGGRDGIFYAFNDNGTIKWQYNVGAPINYSAAYKDGVLYFGADDSYAYALNAANGALVWKSAKFPGVGFDMYWPVVYTDTTVTPNKDWVIFTGSIKGGWMWFMGNTDMYHLVNFDVNTSCPSVSGISYLWPSGTTVLDCGVFSTHLRNNPTRRFTFVLDATTGVEMTFDNGKYPPFNPSPHDGGSQGYRQPPVVGANNVLYSFFGYQAGGNGGATNGVAGWKLGSSYIAPVVNISTTGTDGASDEPRTLTSGGNMVYYGEGNNHQVWGAMEVTKAMGSNAWWTWDSRNISGATAKYTQISLEGKFGGQNGSYSYFDGLQNLSPIPYNGKLYYIQGNILIAVASNGTATSPLSIAQTPATQRSANINKTVSVVNQKLETEVQKIMDVDAQQNKILRPGFHDSGLVGGAMVLPYPGYDIPGDHIFEYFHNPSDTVIALVNARPYLSSALQTKVDAYLQKYFGPGKTYDVSKIAHIGWNNGIKREWGDDSDDMKAVLNGNGTNYYIPLTTQTTICCQNQDKLKIANFPPDSFYGAYKYAQLFPASAKTLFDAMKNNLPVPGSGNGMNNTLFDQYPYLLNQYLTGYRGYLELEKLAGYTTNITQSTKYSAYQSLLATRINNFRATTWWTENDISINIFNNAGNYMYLVPEVINDLLASSKVTQIKQIITDEQSLQPYWFVTKYNRSFSESYSRPLFDYAALFQARAYILKQPFSELVKYLDVPAFERGDLFYIQNLVAALQAASSGPSPTPDPCPKRGQGDVNCDQLINTSDLVLVLTNFNSSSLSYDINKDSRINIFDAGIIFANFGK